MPRIARKNLESCYFHVIVQGYEKEYIFEVDYYVDCLNCSVPVSRSGDFMQGRKERGNRKS